MPRITGFTANRSSKPRLAFGSRPKDGYRRTSTPRPTFLPDPTLTLLAATDSLQCLKMFPRRQRGVHFDRAISCHDCLSNRCQDRAAAAAAARRGLHDRSADRTVEVLD